MPLTDVSTSCICTSPSSDDFACFADLLAQFISRKTNLRTDLYGEPLALLRRIFYEVRALVPPEFIVGIKLNSSDYSSGGLGAQEGIAHLKEISQWNVKGAGVDFIEISGGDYESPGKQLSRFFRDSLFTPLTFRFLTNAISSTNNV